MRLTLNMLAVLALSAGASAQWYVSPTGNNANAGTSAGAPFQTINHAASVATAGGVIYLAAGTYGDEQGVISLGTKNLNFVGAGRTSTIIRAHSSLTSTLPTGFLASPGSAAHKVVWLVDGPATVNLRDATLDGNFAAPDTPPANGRFYGAYFRDGADGTLENVDIKNVRYEPFAGGGNQVDVLVRGDGSGDPCLVSLINCKLTEFGKGGLVGFFNADIEATDTLIRGKGATTLIAQVGVQVSYGASAELSRCTITDILYSPGTVAASGFLAYEASAVALSDCSVSNCQAGIYFVDPTPGAISGSITNCSVSGAEEPITLDGVGGLTISGNYFGNVLSGGPCAYDDGSGNNWSGNSFSNYSGTGTYVIPGGSGASDPAPAPSTPAVVGAPVAYSIAGNAPVDLVVGNLNGNGGSDWATVNQASTPSLSIGLNTGSGYAITTTSFGNGNGQAVAIVSGEFNGSAGLDLAVLTENVPPATTENKVYVFANNGSGAFTQVAALTYGTPTATSGTVVPPAARHNAASAYDSTANRVVLFGGSAPLNGVRSDTQLLNGAAWSLQSPASSPSAREAHTLAYDSQSNLTVLFGGTNGLTKSNDTWTWDGTTWTQLSPATSPSARSSHGAAYDSARDRVVVFGGLGAGFLGDTWEWDGTTWTASAPASAPAARIGHAMTYHGSSTLLFGGMAFPFQLSNQTWTWDGTNWTQLSPAASPSARQGHAMASTGARAVLFGGLTAGGISSETWEWDGTTWAQKSPGTVPAARYGATMSFDSARGVAVLFGGVDASGNLLNDTWLWNGSNWVQPTPVVNGSISPSALAAGDVNGDGLADLAISDNGSGVLTAGNARFLINLGNGTAFLEGELFASPAFAKGCRGIAIGDITGDGKADIVVSEGDATTGIVHRFTGAGTGLFTAAGSATVPANPGEVLISDLDGDGDGDHMVTTLRNLLGTAPGGVEVFEQVGATSYQQSSYLVDRAPRAIATGDIDGDGLVDAAVANLVGGSVSILGSYVSGIGFGSGGIALTGATPTSIGMGLSNADAETDIYYADANLQQVVVLESRPTALVQPYGTGCPGTAAAIPYLDTNGASVQPSTTFGLQLSNSAPFTPAFIALGTTQVQAAACQLLIGNVGASWFAVTSGAGTAYAALPIPSSPSLAGFEVYGQAGVLDTAATGSFFPGIALSAGLKIRIGF